jgi:small GTP-binding protein
MQIDSAAFHGRVVVIGDASVGKTSILNRLVDQTFEDRERPTIGANYQLWIDQIDDLRVELQIWDTAGQEKFRALGPIYFRNAIGALVVYDVTNRDSFEDLEEWISAFSEAAEPGALISLIGNKTDCAPHAVFPDEAKQWAGAQGIELFQTSAKTGEGVREMFSSYVRSLIGHCTHGRPHASRELSPSTRRCSC